MFSDCVCSVLFYVFIGDKYYVFAANQIHPVTPEGGRPLTEYCLPTSVNKVDAVFVWGHNEMTYIISGKCVLLISVSCSTYSFIVVAFCLLYGSFLFTIW